MLAKQRDLLDKWYVLFPRLADLEPPPVHSPKLGPVRFALDYGVTNKTLRVWADNLNQSKGR